MKNLPILFFGILLVLWLAFIAHSSHKQLVDTSYTRRIYFVQGNGLYYIHARDYRGHTIIGNKVILNTVGGPIMLELYQANTRATLEKIAELRAQGLLPPEGISQ